MNLKIGSTTTPPPIESIAALDKQRPKAAAPLGTRASAGVLGAQRPTGAQTRSFGATPVQQSPVIPVPAFPMPGVSTPAPYRAALPAGYAEAGSTFFSENAVPMNSIVLSLPTKGELNSTDPPYNNDALEPRHIAQAALKANPAVQFIVPTKAPFDSMSDPRFAQARADIAQRLGVPAQQVFPVRAGLSWFPQDEFLAGAALTKPEARDVADNLRRTLFGTNELARELGLPVGLAAGIARGGDTHFVDRGGERFSYFGTETVAYTAAAHGLKVDTPQSRLLAIAITMKQMAQAGVPPGNVMPLGRPEAKQDGAFTTYGDVLAQLKPAELARVDPAVLAQLLRMRQLPFPERPYAYHADTFVFTPDGKQMFVRQTVANDPALTATLRFFGFEPVALPAGRIFNPADRELSDPRSNTGKPYLDAEIPVGARLTLNYTNMVQGRSPDGRQLILMPTQASSADQLSATDRQVLALLKQRLPDAVIVPIGGRSALVGSMSMSTSPWPGGAAVSKDWGPHCMSNVLPYIIEPALPAPMGR
jgi:hypothetical protein